MAASEAGVQLLAQAGSLSVGLVAEGSQRRFIFSVDLQHFQAGPRLPLGLAAVVLELELPAELAGLIEQSNGRLPARLAPLRTQVVQVTRGSEAPLAGGQAACDFIAGLMSMATLLVRGPVMTVDVFHKERLADDLLLGRAHVPLAPLLQESWVDGRAGVFALAPSAVDPSQHERVQIGTLHLVMSLEEAGPAAASAAGSGSAAALLPVTDEATASSIVDGSSGRATIAVSTGGWHAAPPSIDPRPPSPPRRPDAAGEQPLVVAETAAQPPVAAAPPSASAPPAAYGLGATPELEAAWELELWKREQQAGWLREIKEREAKRMGALEEMWRRQEQERDAEAAALRSEYAALEGKARQVLAAAEARELKVVAAEEATARRRQELEREHAGRVAEAEATVRRLQAECQHQLELEAQRCERLQQQRAAAEQRAAAGEARAAGAERALQHQREQHSSSEAGQREQELAAARQALATAEQRLAKAADAKRKYKEQVVRLAQEVALLQQQVSELVGVKRAQLGAELAKLQAEEAALAAAHDAAEMSGLKLQLHSLQAGSASYAAGAGSPGTSAAASSGGGGGSNKENAQGAVHSSMPHGLFTSSGRDGCVLHGELCGAVERLLRERELLLGSGAYSSEDALIQQLDRRIRECAELARPAR